MLQSILIQIKQIKMFKVHFVYIYIFKLGFISFNIYKNMCATDLINFSSQRKITLIFIISIKFKL